MPKLKCRCGNVINLSPIPCPDGYKLLSEMCIDALYPAASVDAAVHEVITQSEQSYLCPACGRLIVIWEGEEDQWRTVSYLPEGD